ncbi:MAG: hypothetical protein PHC34_13625, partial [Candidatus Gastranaerophilales bacterium]|nr:hypothetical protein [Candidatus Gastranaerophilales bacterium]
MIILKIIGGIGNQMFQYALGLYLAKKHDTELKLDISDFYKYSDREFYLNILNINTEIATKEEIAALSYFKERYFDFDSEVLNLPDNTYLEGYWQSEKYFNSVENCIKENFTFKEEPKLENKAVLEKILNSNSVA